MDAVILTQTFTGWIPQCYRITSCRFIQFKSRFTSFSTILDTNDTSQIEQHHDINHMQSIASLSSGNETILQVDINQIQIFLKFYFQKEFIAFYRVLCASKPIHKCSQRPIPSNISFAIYHILQNLYHSSKTMDLLKLDSNNDIRAIQSIKKFSYDLVVNNDTKWAKNTDINTLYQTLIYSLTNMPTSLFTFEYEQKLSDLVMKIAQKREAEECVADNLATDKYILLFNDKNALEEMKNAILDLYSRNKQTYKKQNGFHLFNRYGFLTILFTFLHFICAQNSSAIVALTKAFSCALKSKQSDHENQLRAKEHLADFEILIRILIHYAPHIFSAPNIMQWNIASLISYSGNEMKSMHQYNERVKEKLNLRKLIVSAQKLQQNLDIKDRKYMFKKYKECFVGRDAVKIMIELKLATDINEALVFGNKLLKNGIIKHVENAHQFKDANFFYEFIHGFKASLPHSIAPKIQSVYKFDANAMKFDANLEIKEEEIIECEIGEYQLPLNALFMDKHPGYISDLQLQESKSGSITIEAKCSKVDSATNEDEDEMFATYKYVVDLEIVKGSNLQKTSGAEYTFIVVNVLNKMKRSKVVSRSNEKCVLWNERMHFELFEEPETLFFTLYNTNKKDKELEDVINKDAAAVEVKVEIISGYNLNTSLLPIEFNPFLKLKIAHKTFKSNTIYNAANNPLWKQKTAFVFNHQVEKILFQVFNERRAPQTAQLIGEKYYQIKKDSEEQISEITDLIINDETQSGIKVKVAIAVVSK